MNGELIEVRLEGLIVLDTNRAPWYMTFFKKKNVELDNQIVTKLLIMPRLKRITRLLEIRC